MIRAGETPIGWQDYVGLILRRRWYFTIPCVTIVVLTMLIALVLPKIYRAETILLIQDPKIMNPLMEGMAVSSPVDVRMRVVQEELLGWTSLSRLAHELRLDRNIQTPVEFEDIIHDLQRAIVVTSRGGNLLSLTYQSPDPEMAQRVLNTVTNIYIQRNVESQTNEAEAAIRFIDTEMTVYKQRLEDSERALREFRELYAMDMPVATQLNNQIIALEVQLAQLLVENTEEHPTVIQVKRQIHDLKRNRNAEIKRVIATAVTKSRSPEIYEDLAKALESPTDQLPADPTVQTAKEVYKAWVDRLDSPATAKPSAVQVVSTPVAGPIGQAPPALQLLRDGGGMTSISLAPRQDQEMSRLTRDYEVHRKTYQEMKERLELARVTQRLGQSDEGTKFKIIEPARLPLGPVFPNLWLFFVTSLAVGILVGVTTVFVVEYLDQSFQSAEELQAALALPVIGSISTIVTEDDIKARQRRYRRWMSAKNQVHRVKSLVITPLWNRVDRALVRRGL